MKTAKSFVFSIACAFVAVLSIGAQAAESNGADDAQAESQSESVIPGLESRVASLL